MEAQALADFYFGLETKDVVCYRGFYIDAIGIRHLLADLHMAKENMAKNVPRIQEKFTIEVLKKRKALQPVGKLSYGEALYYWLWARQTNGIEQMYYNGWTDEARDKLDGFLPDEIKEMGNWFIEQGTTVNYDKMNRVYKQMFYVDMPPEENYFRMFFEGGDNVDLDTIQFGGYVAPSANIGSLIARVVHKKNLKRMNAFDVWNQSIIEQEHYINFAMLSQELRAVFKNADILNAIEDIHGEEVKKIISTQIDNVIRGGIDPKLMNKVVMKLRNAITQTVYLGKLIMLPKLAITGSVQYCGEVDMGKYAKCLAKFWSHPLDNFKSAFKSDYIQDRWLSGEMMPELAALKQFSKGNPFRKMDKASYVGMWSVRAGDIGAASIGYWIVRRIKFDEFRKQGMTIRQAANEAGIETARIIDRVQGSGEVKDWGYHQSLGSWQNLLQLFQTNNRLFSTYTINDIRAAYNGKENSLKPMARKMAFYWVIGSLLYQFLDDMIKEGFDPDHDIEPEDYAIAVLTMPAAGLFLATNVVNAGIRRIFGKKWGNNLNLIPGSDSIWSAIGNAIDELKDGDPVEAFTDAMNPLGAYQTFNFMTARLKE